MGSYVTWFELDKGEVKNRSFLRFEGVETAFYVWINGAFVGPILSPLEIFVQACKCISGEIPPVCLVSNSLMTMLLDAHLLDFHPPHPDSDAP